MAELVIGRRYLISMAPWGIATVRYLGPVPGIRNRSRVENVVTGRRAWVKTEHLRPLLYECGRGRAAHDDTLRDYALNLIRTTVETKP